MNRKERRKLEKKIGKDLKQKQSTPIATPVIARQAPPMIARHDIFRYFDITPNKYVPSISSVRLHVPIDVTRGVGRKINNNLTVCMLGLPCYVCVHDYKYSDEKISDIVDDIADYYDSLFRDYFDFDDVDQVLSEEANLVISEVAKTQGITKEHQDQTFLIVIGTAIMTMMDKYGFDSTELRKFTEKLIYRYTLYKRGFITNYELIQLLKKRAGVSMAKE